MRSMSGPSRLMVEFLETPMERVEIEKDAGATAALAKDCVVAVDRPLSSEERMFQKVNFDLDIEDSLDAQGASSTLVLTLVEREDKSLNITRAVGEGDVFIALPCRCACLWSMSDLLHVMNMPQTSWFQAVVLFDAYCRRQPPGADLTHIPSLCVALMVILKKADCATVCWQGTNMSANLSSHAAQLAKWLQNLGVNADEGSAELIVRQERQLLETLGWRVNLPSLEQWLTIFCARFNLLTGMMFQDSLNWVWQQSLRHGRWLILQQPSCPAIPSRRLARGITCMMLINVALLPLQAMRPQKLSDWEWYNLFVKSHPHGTVPDCKCMATHVERILKILQLATGHNIAALQTDCELVVMLSRELLREMDRRPMTLFDNANVGSSQIAGVSSAIGNLAACAA